MLHLLIVTRIPTEKITHEEILKRSGEKTAILEKYNEKLSAATLESIELYIFNFNPARNFTQ